MAPWYKPQARKRTQGKTQYFFNLTDTDEIDENAEEMTSHNGNYFQLLISQTCVSSTCILSSPFMLFPVTDLQIYKYVSTDIDKYGFCKYMWVRMCVREIYIYFFFN